MAKTSLLAVVLFVLSVATAEGRPTFIFSEARKIFRLEEGSRRPEEIPIPRPQHTNPLSVDFDARERRLYWTEYTLKRIFSSNLNGTDVRLVRELNLAAIPFSLAVDDKSRLVIFADRGNRLITMVTMIGGYVRNVLNRGLENPLSVALDKSDGLVFYADGGPRPKIGSVYYNGTGNRLLVSTDMGQPTGVAVDDEAGFVYWCDHTRNRIESYDYRGSRGRELLLHIEGAQFFALDPFGDSLYFTAWNHSYIRRLPKTGGNASTIELDDPLSQQVGDIRVVDLNQTSSQPAEPVGCGCSHICVPAGSGAAGWQCLCPDGLTLTADGRTCTTDPDLDRFILMADKDLGRLFRVDLNIGHYVELPINVTTPIGVDYDVIDGRVYFSDVRQRIIGSARLDGSGYKIVRRLNSVAVPDGLELDPKARLLFYSDTGNDIIASMNLNGSNYREILTLTLDQPRGLSLDIEDRVVYYTDWGTQAKIARISYEGTNHDILVTSDLFLPNGLTLDRKAGRLYWCDAGVNKIESVRTDGTDRQLLLQTAPDAAAATLAGLPVSPFDADTHYFGIDLHNGYLYISDWKSRSLLRMKTNVTRLTVFGANDFLAICDVHVVDKEQALQAIRGDTTTTSSVPPTSTSPRTTRPDGGDTTATNGERSSSTSPTTSEPKGDDSTTTDGELSSSPPPPTSGSQAILGLTPVVAGGVMGGLGLMIVIVILIAVIFCRKRRRAKNTGRAYYQGHRDSDYAHLHESGSVPPPDGQVNVTLASGEHPYDTYRDSNIYDVIKDYSGNPPPDPQSTLYLHPLKSEA